MSEAKTAATAATAQIITKSGTDDKDRPYTITVDLKERTIIATIGKRRYGNIIRAYDTKEKTDILCDALQDRNDKYINAYTTVTEYGTKIFVIESYQKGNEDYLEAHVLACGS